MKKTFWRTLLPLLLLSVGFTLLMSSCEPVDDGWGYNPPPGWGSNYFFDSRLEGSWELVQANSQPVDSYDTNYMEFYGRGHGGYFYYSRNRLISEDMAYFCQRSGSTTTNYQINIQYEDGSESTMAYWFTDNGDSLWLQWMTTGGRTQTYIYARVNSIP